jgi:hypothetical protein
MLKYRSRVRFAVIASALICSLSGSAHATDDAMSKRQLTKTMAKVRKGKTSTVRTEAAEHLAELTRGIDPQKVDDTTLAELVSLLDISEDSVRYWVAASLGNLGPRARVAVPTLLKLLPEVDCLRGSLTSAPAIRTALERMGVTPPPPACGTASK